MATSAAKTIVATGLSSGLGFEALKQLLQQTQTYKIILGARNTQSTIAAIDAISSSSKVTVLPLELSDLNTVKSFSAKTLDLLGEEKVDYLYMNAGLAKDASQPAPNGSKWCETLVVNHTSQHYLVHLLREKLVASKSRLVFVSSGAIRNVADPSRLEKELAPPSDAQQQAIYSGSKFVQYLGAQWWRRQLAGQCRVVAVSPGLIPGTGLFRHAKTGMIPPNHPDAKSNEQGGANINAALFRDDFPEDPEQIFLTSWGEWWSKDVYANALDQELQNKWCLSKEEIEKQEGVAV